MTEYKDPKTGLASEPPNFVLMVGLLVCVSIGLMGYGLYQLYDFNQEKIVGGDAFNFIIYSSRATAWICAGIVTMLIATVMAIYDVYHRYKFTA